MQNNEFEAQKPNPLVLQKGLVSINETFGIDKISIYATQGGYDKLPHAPKNWGTITNLQPKKTISDIERGDNLSIKYYRNDLVPDSNIKFQSHIDVDKDMLVIQFNPSKENSEYKLNNDVNNVQEQINRIVKHLEKDNVIVDIPQTRIGRLDLALNMELTEDLENYQIVCDSLKAKRAMKRKTDSSNYWGNKESQNVIYDKNKEIIERLPNYNFSNTPKISRSEVRFLNSSSILTEFKTKNYLKIISDTNFGKVYNNYIEQRLLRPNKYVQIEFDLLGMEKMYGDMKRTMQINNRSRGYFDMLIKNIGLIKIAETPNAFDYLIRLIHKEHTRATAYRLEKQLRAEINICANYRGNEQNNFVRLNTEFREKILYKIA